MRLEDIRSAHDALPFQPFSLVLADGRAFRIPHPDFLSMGPKGTALVFWTEEGHIGSILDAALIAEIRMETNGTRRPKRRKA
jgi:hypothetical protein